MSKPIVDDFNGDNAHLIRSARALVHLNDDGALVPCGIGGHARDIICALLLRLQDKQFSGVHNVIRQMREEAADLSGSSRHAGVVDALRRYADLLDEQSPAHARVHLAIGIELDAIGELFGIKREPTVPDAALRELILNRWRTMIDPNRVGEVIKPKTGTIMEKVQTVTCGFCGGIHWAPANHCMQCGSSMVNIVPVTHE